MNEDELISGEDYDPQSLEKRLALIIQHGMKARIYRWSYLDLGGTGPIPPAEPGTKLDPSPDVAGAYLMKRPPTDGGCIQSGSLVQAPHRTARIDQLLEEPT